MRTTNNPTSAIAAARWAELAADSAVMAYIHEISERHRPAQGGPQAGVTASDQ